MRTLPLTALTIGVLIVSTAIVPAGAPAPAAAAIGDPENHLVSRTDAGSSDQSAVSADGQHVVFRSTEALVPEDTNGAEDVYLASAAPGSADPFSGAPALISRSVDGGAADGASGEPAVSADGRYVAFSSTATDLTTDAATPGRRSIYVRDTVVGTTIRIQDGDSEPNGDSEDPAISADGGRIVFDSRATNLVAGDADTGSDIIVVDRDADGDGAFTSLSIRNATDDPSETRDYAQAGISGNGRTILYWTSAYDPIHMRPGGSISIADFGDLFASGFGASLGLVTFGPSAIDASGTLIAAVIYNACEVETVVAFSLNGPSLGGVAVGQGDPAVDGSVGHISEVAISADGSRVAWASTQPLVSGGGQALPQPVVRADDPFWTPAAAAAGIDCSPAVRSDVRELGPGTAPSLSASGRSIVFSGPSALADGATSAVVDVDTHSNTSGLAVTTQQGEVGTAAYLREADTAEIPASALHDFADAFANAPIHRLPIHRLPIHRLPIHRLPIHRLPILDLPIHRLPIHRLDLPGGWQDVLVGTPFEGRSELEVTLEEVLAWADATRDDPAATPEQLAAVARIDGLTLDSVDVDGTGIDALSLGALMLGDAPVATLALPGTQAGTGPWQDLVTAQGVAATVDADTLLADLDWAGLDIAKTGVDDIPLASIPSSRTLLDAIHADELELSGTVLGGVPVDQLSNPAAVLPAGATGTLADNAAAFLPGTTAASLAAVVPASVTFGDLLTALLDRISYPWEQIDPSTLNAASVARDISTFGCGSDPSCIPQTTFTYSFDPGPGEPVEFAQAVARMFLPMGTTGGVQIVSASGARAGGDPADAPALAYRADGERVTAPLGDMDGGTVLTLRGSGTITAILDDGEVRGELIVGDAMASARSGYYRPLDDYDDSAHNMTGGAWNNGAAPAAMEEGVIYYGWVSPLYKQLDDDGVTVEGPAADADYYTVKAPSAGQRVIISTNATDGQVSLALYQPDAATTELGIASAGLAPGTGTTEQAAGTDGSTSTIGSDAGAPLSGSVLVDQEVVAGDGSAQVVAAGLGDSADLLLRVTSGNGEPSASLYSLRVQYVDEPVSAACSPWSAPTGAESGTAIPSDGVTDATNTIYLFDARRFDDTWGVGAAADVIATLRTLDGTGDVGGAPISGAVLTVDSDPAVAAARTVSDANPCDMSARAALTRSVNAYVAGTLDTHRAHIGAVVIVGGDDILPLAPVAQNTGQFNEQSHAADLRLDSPPGGAVDDPCPPVDDAGVDLCATPLSAAAATNHILTDDPYALATAYRTVGGTLYVPSVAIGRLVDSPAQVKAAIARFTAQSGTLAAGSSLTGGYGAWTDLPAAVTNDLAWRSSPNTQLVEPWSATDLASTLFPSTGDSADVVSVNAHFDETRMLPGVLGAEDGVFTDSQLYRASSPTAADAAKLAGSLIFTIGCHAGDNLPESYYPGVTDWVDVFGSAGGFVGNTGYGLANDTTTALSARLLDLYAQWIGVTSGGSKVSSGGALVQAKRAYLAGLGLYSGYDEKALMEAVYYGLPMYTFSGPTKTPPLPEIPDYLGPAPIGDGLTAASLSLAPAFTRQSAGDATYVTVGGEAPAVIAGEPVLPKTTVQLMPAPAGTTARGALITGLTSDPGGLVTPLIADGTAGVGGQVSGTRDDIVFPSSFAHITTQQTPAGPVDLLVVTPARVHARVGGQGTIETFSHLDLQVVYGAAGASDTTEPAFTAIDTSVPHQLRATVDGTGGDVVRVLALVQAEGSDAWTAYELTAGTSEWAVGLPGDLGAFRWILQAVDGAGNVGVASNRGLLGTAGQPAPTLGDPGPDATVAVGDHLLRSIEVTDASADDRITATFAVTSGGSATASGSAAATVGDDGRTRVTLDHVPSLPGSYVISVTACRADACTTASFGLTVPEQNHAPTAEVSLDTAAELVSPRTTLTAKAVSADADGDPVSLAYRWLRNEQPIADETAATISLTGIAQTGDTITVEATPADGKVNGGAARASVVVSAAVPAPPTITATAATASGPYVEGSWSASPVTVTFACHADAPTYCSTPQTVSADTGPDGVTVTGRVEDAAGGTASVSLLVRVDATAPSLHPTVSPDPVLHDAVATATPNASDAGSGVAAESCDTPSTATLGAASVTCRATDAAGNTATAAVPYWVLPRTPARCLGVPDRTALAPLNADGSSIFLRVSGIPIAFRACDEQGRPIGTEGFVTSVTLVATGALPKKKANVTEFPSFVPTIAPVYSRLSQTWIGSIGARTLTPGKTYTYRITLADGTSFTLTFGLK